MAEILAQSVLSVRASQQWGTGPRARALSAAGAGLGLLLTGCGDLVYLFPQNNRNNEIDVQIQDDNVGTQTAFKLSDEEGYFATEFGPYQFSWPAFDQYGQTGEFAYIQFYPLFPGVQALYGGQVNTAGLSWSMSGQQVDFDIRWEGSRSFPFVHSGTFLGTSVGGVSVTGDFTLSNMNCLADSFDYDSEYECGRGFQVGGSYDVDWSVRSDLNWCPQGVVDALLGTGREGSVSGSRLTLGDVSMPCVEGYNKRVMCGQDPVTVEVDGCTWQVLGRGGPAGYSTSSVTGWFVVSASAECNGEPQLGLCETWLTGTPRG